MKPSDVNDIVNSWYIGELRGIEYRDYTIYSSEWLIVRRTEDNLFEVLADRSSVDTGPFKKKDMERLFSRDLMKIHDPIPGNDNYKFKKSDNCVCGAWATTEPNLHAYYCPKCRKI
jgi:hypothetical protein